MPKKMAELVCSPEERKRLEALAENPLEDARAAIRAKIVLAYLDMQPLEKITEDFQVSRSMIFRWRGRFAREGVAGLRDKPRTGKPAKYNEEFERQVFEMLRQPPPDGQPRWDGAALARALHASDDAIWRILRRYGVALTRQRVWSVPAGSKLQDLHPEVEGLYLAPPVAMLALCPGGRGDAEPLVVTRDKNAGLALQQESKGGPLSLTRAIEILGSFARGSEAELRPREDVIAFLDDMEQGRRKGQPMQVMVLGNAALLGITGWMAAHTDVEFFFYASMEEAAAMMETHLPIRQESGEYTPLTRMILQYPASAYPFVWKKIRGGGIVKKFNTYIQTP